MVPLPIEEVLFINEMNNLHEELIETKLKTRYSKKYLSQLQINFDGLIKDFNEKQRWGQDS